MFARNILLLAPHPDDEVAGCAAAIGRARAQGCRVFCAWLTTGIPDEDALWPWQHSRRTERVHVRRSEAERAAETLDIRPIWFQDIPTRRVKDSLAQTYAGIERLLGETAAEVLWCPAYEGGHQDHDTTNFLASLFRDRVSVWEFSEYNFAGSRVQSNRFPTETGREREIVLEEEERGRKRELLNIYRSERLNLRYIASVREVFRLLGDYDYSRPPHAGKLFYERFQWARGFSSRVDPTQPEEVCRALTAFRTSRSA